MTTDYLTDVFDGNGWLALVLVLAIPFRRSHDEARRFHSNGRGHDGLPWTDMGWAEPDHIV